jgi:hypothetical protein
MEVKAVLEVSLRLGTALGKKNNSFRGKEAKSVSGRS